MEDWAGLVGWPIAKRTNGSRRCYWKENRHQTTASSRRTGCAYRWSCPSRTVGRRRTCASSECRALGRSSRNSPSDVLPAPALPFRSASRWSPEKRRRRSAAAGTRPSSRRVERPGHFPARADRAENFEYCSGAPCTSTNTIASSLRITYSMRDLICDANYCVWGQCCGIRHIW